MNCVNGGFRLFVHDEYLYVIRSRERKEKKNKKRETPAVNEKCRLVAVPRNCAGRAQLATTAALSRAVIFLRKPRRPRGALIPGADDCWERDSSGNGSPMKGLMLLYILRVMSMSGWLVITYNGGLLFLFFFFF